MCGRRPRRIPRWRRLSCVAGIAGGADRGRLREHVACEVPTETSWSPMMAVKCHQTGARPNITRAPPQPRF